MVALTKETRRQLVDLARRQPAGLPLGQVPAALLEETRAVLREAFAELGYFGRFECSKAPGTSGGVGFGDEARWLLMEGSRGDPEEAVRRLEQLVIKNEATLQRVEAVWGLHPDRPITLSNDLTLMPLADLRSSPARDALLEADDSKHPYVRQAKPRAAIVQEFVYRPLYFSSPEAMAPFTWDDKHFMSDLASVLVLLNDSPVVCVAGWYQADPQVPVLGVDRGWGGNFHEPRIAVEIAPQAYDEALAFQLVAGFLEFSPSDRRRMTIALRRLNLAFLRQMPSDIALELGIAIEVLLSATDDPPDSMSYRLKTRAAVLLGGSISEREETDRQVAQLYGLRSTAAHGEDLDGHWRGDAKVPRKGKKYTAGELTKALENGKELCSQIARKILQLGTFPNYHRMMLGETVGTVEPLRD